MSAAMLFCANLNPCDASRRDDFRESHTSRERSGSPGSGEPQRPTRAERRRQVKSSRKHNKSVARAAKREHNDCKI